MAGISETIAKLHHDRGSRFKTHAVPFTSPRDIPGLNSILHIDLATSTVCVEPNVTMEALVKATSEYGLVPAVVAASKNSTVGDAFASTTNESSSFQYGTFDCTVLAAEVILGNGQLVLSRAGDAATEDLLYGSAGAMHSLGLITMFEIALIKAGPYVELTYWPVSSAPETLRKMREVQLDSSIDYVDGILFSPSSGIVITGRFSPSAKRISRPRFSSGNDFSQHAQSIWCAAQRTRKPHIEFLPALTYLFRYDSRSAIKHGNRMLSSFLNRKSHGVLSRGDPLLFQGFGVPHDAVEELIECFCKTRDIWPIWVFPVRPPQLLGCRRSFGIGSDFESTMWNLGFWSSSSTCNSMLERYLLDVKAFRYLHTRTPCSRDTVWVFHDDRWYGRLRSHWKAENFADIGEKICV